MTWHRDGKITTAENSSYYAKPLLLPSSKGCQIIFTDRDSNNCSLIKMGTFSILGSSGEITGEQILYAKDPFDPLEANGVIATTYIVKGNEIFLFCTAFHYDNKKNFLSSPFMLVIDQRTYDVKRKLKLKIQQKDIPTGCGGALKENGLTYLTFESRFQKNETFSFELKLATSEDMIKWDISKNFSLMPKEDEHYLSSPIFLKFQNKFLIAYSLKKDGRYSIKFTGSSDLVTWYPIPEMSFTPSPENEWENEEVCYPFLWINEKNEICMLYNGNKYGKFGIGMATWK